jgi:thiol-disulfide isomerase/thioredoxin
VSGNEPATGNGIGPAYGSGGGPSAESDAGPAAGSSGGTGQDANAPALPSDDSPAMLAADDEHSAVDQTLLDLGVDPATPVTLVQFSSAFCAPCRTTRRVLADVAGLVAGVTHLEVDAESHLDAVRALDIWRTPTTLIVAGGRVVQRASGVPAKAQVLAAVAPMLDRAA